MHPNSLKNTEANKFRATDYQAGELGKVIGTRYPLDVEAALSELTAMGRSAYIRTAVIERLKADGLLAEGYVPCGTQLTLLGLRPQTKKCLEDYGCTTVEKILTSDELAIIPGIDLARSKEIRECLKQSGFEWDSEMGQWVMGKGRESPAAIQSKALDDLGVRIKQLQNELKHRL